MSLETLEADTQEVVALWAGGPPGGAAAIDEVRFRSPVAGGEVTEMLRNVAHPTLTVFRPDLAKANGVGVIVAPGGGWRILAWRHEGIDLAQWLAERGYTAFLLKYRLMPTRPDPAEYARLAAESSAQVAGRLAAMKPPRSIKELLTDEATPAAMKTASADGRRALALVRERAADWGVKPDRIGMIGFSAGAFVTVDVALEPEGPPLAFAAPIYGGETGGRPVPADAPPLFIAVAADDQLLFKVVEGLYADWTDAGRPGEMHAFAKGGHGFGMARQGLPSDRWIDLFGAWLADLGFA